MKLSKDISWSVVDNEMLIVDHNKNEGYVFDESGLEIFNLLIKGNNAEQITKELINKYGKQFKIAISKDVIEFINEIKKLNIVVDE